MLNNANVLIKRNPEEASKVLFKLEDLLRYQINDSSRERVALASDIRFLNDYLNLEKIRRDSEAPKLTPYEGDWVYQRTTKYDPLTIMGIWRAKQIRVWSFKFENMDRLGYEAPEFEVTDTGLKVGAGSSATLYTLSADKNVLTCVGCSKPVSWVKADPKKDLSDRYYARKIAGNP